MTHSTFAHPYFGAFMLFVITIAAFSATLWIQRYLSNKLASKSREKLKVSTYECGVIANRQQNRISTHYYLIALLFILFDVEIIFMFPWAVNFKALGLFGFVEMILFIALLTLGFIYAWRKGALLWQSLK
ncbi:NAD(P)H-quinone oxidoreductase subunit 3 [Helicobacter sp. 23-1045]